MPPWRRYEESSDQPAGDEAPHKQPTFFYQGRYFKADFWQGAQNRDEYDNSSVRNKYDEVQSCCSP